MLKLLYRHFLRWMARGDVPEKLRPQTLADVAHRIPPEVRARFNGLSYLEVDRAATEAGEQYRGLGIAVGLMGAVVVLLAVVPDAFGLTSATSPKEPKLVLGAVKLLLMLAMLALIGFARFAGLKSSWIDIRLLAEELRYEGLRHARDQAVSAVGDETAVAALRIQMLKVLEGEHGQIEYNERNAAHYERIELFVKQLTYRGFFISMLAAAASMGVTQTPYKAPWLLVFTASLPAAIGALHGVLGFLRLSELIAEHERMAATLMGLLNEMNALETTIDEPEKLVTIANNLLQLLSGGDTVWTAIAAKSVVLP